MTAVPGFDAAILKVNRQGDLLAYTSTPSQGQGQYTTFAQLLAQDLGIGIDQIHVHLGDTSTSPYGSGTFASRSLVSGGGALLKAAEKLKTRLIHLAAAVWKIEPEQIGYVAGAVVGHVNGTELGLSFAELAAIANAPLFDLPEGIEPGLEIHCAYDPPGTTTAAGIHVALIEIDRQTGQVTIPRYMVAEDCGRVLKHTGCRWSNSGRNLPRRGDRVA